jgi:putative endonuclease
MFFLNTNKLSTKNIGDKGERIAVVFLRKNKYKIVNNNYRTRYSEIDIIAWKRDRMLGKVLCFVEVKTRKFDDGSAERATDFEKIKHIMHGARQFCLENNIDIDKTAISFEHISIFLEEKENVRHFVLPIE